MAGHGGGARGRVRLRVLGDSLLSGEPGCTFTGVRARLAKKQGRIGELQRYVITIKGRNFEDVDSAELAAPPEPGETIETSLGQCIVISADPPDEGRAVGKIVCRLP